VVAPEIKLATGTAFASLMLYPLSYRLIADAGRTRTGDPQIRSTRTCLAPGATEVCAVPPEIKTAAGLT